MDALLALGPFGFRGPAHEDIPRHLSSNDGETRTTQVIVPGYRCPSQALISACIHQIEERFIYVTSANQSHHRTGRDEEPAHWKAAPLAAEFEHVDELFVMTHRDEERARELHPDHLPMSTSILSFHRQGLDRCPTVRLERLGSMGTETIRELVHHHGFKLEVAPSAEHDFHVAAIQLSDLTSKREESNNETRDQATETTAHRTHRTELKHHA